MKRPLLASQVLVLVCTSTLACGHLLFFPSTELQITPKAVGMSYEDVFFDSTDSTRLHAWWLPAR